VLGAVGLNPSFGLSSALEAIDRLHRLLIAGKRLDIKAAADPVFADLVGDAGGRLLGLAMARRLNILEI
jgi:hypothetical protein